MLVYNLQLKKSQRLKYNLPHTKGKINSVIDYVSARVTFVIFFFFSIFLSCANVLLNTNLVLDNFLFLHKVVKWLQ